MAATNDVVVAGHVCLDIIPQLSNEQARAEDLFVPGRLFHVGPASVTLGGCVANTGRALHQLGARTRFVSKVGDDIFGNAILETLKRCDANVAETMIVAPGEATSYSIVLSPPQVDRGILHCPGTNHTFVAEDLNASAWRGSRVLHFGYPPLMQGTLTDQGKGLADKFAAVQSDGLLVSLDMAMPDTSPSATPTDWRQWLGHVLPHVDVFLPSTDELLLMLGGSGDSKANQAVGPAALDGPLLSELAGELLDMGVPIVVIKLGDQGLYLRTSAAATRLSNRAEWKDLDWQAWSNRELLAPCFQVKALGTLGSGDCTIAGFLMAMLQGNQPTAVIRYATAVGAFCVQSAEATSSIPPWSEVEARLQTDWQQTAPSLVLQEWQYCQEQGVYYSPADACYSAVSKGG